MRRYLKIWLDDERPTPEGWVGAETAEEAIVLLKTEMVSHVSLDHDLGDPDPNKTGYLVACWIEEAVHEIPGYIAPFIMVHSANPVGRARIQQIISKLQ